MYWKKIGVVIFLMLLPFVKTYAKKKGHDEQDSDYDSEEEVEYIDWNNVTSTASPQISNSDKPQPPARQNFPTFFDPELDIILGLRRNEFVQVKIGEFSTTDAFARVYGKAANYSKEDGNIFQVGEFLGVPYAEPPINHLRFQRSELLLPPDELLALRHPSPCPQLSPDDNSAAVGTEDCLYLSIYSPALDVFQDDLDYYTRTSTRKLPVLVWFHGESPTQLKHGIFSVFSSGSAQDVDPTVWLQRNMVVVTPQYRLGLLGFLSAGSEDLNGNMGLFDMITALEWVHRFIHYFGGDPTQITVMGQGSSATALGLISTSAIAQTRPNLFQRMILMSGSPVQPLAIDTNQKLTFLEAARLNNCPPLPTLQFVRCMQAKPAKDIVLSSASLSQGKHIGKWKLPLGVIQKPPDKRFLPPLIFEAPFDKLSQGSGVLQKVPVIIGVTNSELSGFLESLSGVSGVSLRTTLFSNTSSTSVLKQFIRQILSRSEFSGLNLDTVSQLVSFEYFAGLVASERQEQAEDLLAEMLADYLIVMPVFSMANLWSKLAPVYLYVFDYVPTSAPTDVDAEARPNRAIDEPQTLESSQAIHGSDLGFLTKSYANPVGSSQDRLISNLMVDLWSTFIKTGSPDNSNFWPAYTDTRQEYLYISDRLEIRRRFRSRQEQFWSDLLKQISSTCKT